MSVFPSLRIKKRIYAIGKTPKNATVNKSITLPIGYFLYLEYIATNNNPPAIAPINESPGICVNAIKPRTLLNAELGYETTWKSLEKNKEAKAEIIER